MDQIEAVKERILAGTPFISLVESRLPLKRNGRNHIACCPFHDEKTPSFYVYDDHYHCYGCKAHGDAISWVQHFEGFSFIESLKWLAKTYSIQADELERKQSHQTKERLKARSQKREVMNAALGFFKRCLANERIGQSATKYLKERGFSESSVKGYEFGYAPQSAQENLLQYLKTKGYSEKITEECSLLSRYDNRMSDFFFDRLIIPIYDAHGELIAFGGRTLSNAKQKYKNSRYDKSSTLFGFDRARAAMRQKNRAIVVEGYLDALKLWQFGFEETVACQGTALTKQHLKLLSKVTKNIYLAFDGDAAGKSAAFKSIELMDTDEDIIFRYTKFAKDEDPDSFIAKHGHTAFEENLSRSIPLIEALTEDRLHNTDPAEIATAFKKEILPLLKRYKDPIQRHFFIHRMSQKLAIPPQLIASWAEEPTANRSVLAKKPEPEIKTITMPITLEPVLKEYLAHLYFAQPEEVDLPAIESFISSKLEAEPCLFEFIEKALQELRRGQSPSKSGRAAEEWDQNGQLSDIIEHIEAHSGAYATDKRRKSLTRLQLIYRRNKMRETIQELKKQVTINRLRNQDLANREIAREVSDILKQINGISHEISLC